MALSLVSRVLDHSLYLLDESKRKSSTGLNCRIPLASNCFLYVHHIHRLPIMPTTRSNSRRVTDRLLLNRAITRRLADNAGIGTKGTRQTNTKRVSSSKSVSTECVIPDKSKNSRKAVKVSRRSWVNSNMNVKGSEEDEDRTSEQCFPQQMLADRLEYTLCVWPDCPVAEPHGNGYYFHEGKQPPKWNEKFGCTNPPPVIWAAYSRLNHGESSREDESKIDSFLIQHTDYFFRTNQIFTEGPTSENVPFFEFPTVA